MLTERLLVGLCRFVRAYLYDTAARTNQAWVKDFPRAAEHRWRHTLNVLRNAEKIVAGEGADQETVDVVRAGALLHDVSMFVAEHAVHGAASADIAREHLREKGYPATFIERVATAVSEHGIDLGPLSPAEQGALLSFEGRTLIEADILDKLGASAVTGALLALGAKGLLYHECRSALVKGAALERATLFKDYVWSPTGRRLAADRYRYLEDYLARLACEVDDGSDRCDGVEGSSNAAAGETAERG